MNRSDLPEFIGYFCLFNAISTLVTFYWLYASEQVRATPLVPGSTVPLGWQWVVVGLSGLLSAICAVALIRRLPWARTALAIQLLWGGCGWWFFTKDHHAIQALGLAIAALPLLIALSVPIVRVNGSRRLSLSRHAFRAAGIGLYGCAVAVIYVTVTAQFTGTSPTASSPAMSSGGAIGYFGVALLLMWFGGALWNDRERARRVAGNLLTALATFMVFQCTYGYFYTRTYYPQVQGLYHWDAALQSLVILAMIGFTLVGLSGRA